MKQPKRSGKRQKSDLGSIIGKRINKGPALGDLVVPRELKDSKLEQDCEKRIKLISAKLDEGNVRAGIRLAASDDTVAPFDNNTYEKLQSKHPPRAPNHAQQVVEDSLIVFEPTVMKAINSFPSGSSGGPSILVPQLYKDLIAKSNGPNEFLQKLTSVLIIVLEGKIPVGLRPFFFGAKLISLRKKDGGVRPIAVGNTLRRICSKSVSSFATDQRRIDYHGTQFGCGTSRGAEIAAHVFRNLIENEKNPDNVVLRMDFKYAFNSLKREKILRKRRQIYNYTHSAYSETSHLFFGDKVFQLQEGCQQGDPEGPALFSDTIQDLVNQMISQYNVWYLDDGNLSNHYRTVLEDLKRIIASADEYGFLSKKLNVT